MVDHGHVARIAFDDVAALAAHDECREAAAVEEDDGLLPGCQCLFQEIQQAIGNDAVIPAGQFIAHVDDLDRRQGPLADALCQLDQDIIALQGLIVVAQRRRGTAKNYGAAVVRRPLAGHGDGMIARRFILLIRTVMGFVDDEQANGLGRRKDSRPGTDTDMARPVLHTQPVVALLTLGKLAVHDDDIVAEAAQETADDLPGQGDFRH